MTFEPMKPEPPVMATSSTHHLRSRAAPSEAMTWSTCSSVMTAETGRQMWREQMLLGARQRTVGAGLEDRLEVQRRLVHLTRQADLVLLAQRFLSSARSTPSGRKAMYL